MFEVVVRNDIDTWHHLASTREETRHWRDTLEVKSSTYFGPRSHRTIDPGCQVQQAIVHFLGRGGVTCKNIRLTLDI